MSPGPSVAIIIQIAAQQGRTQGIMASTAAIVDALWYCIVTIVVSRGSVVRKFSRYGPVLKKIFAVFLIVVAIRIVWR